MNSLHIDARQADRRWSRKRRSETVPALDRIMDRLFGEGLILIVADRRCIGIARRAYTGRNANKYVFGDINLRCCHHVAARFAYERVSSGSEEAPKFSVLCDRGRLSEVPRQPPDSPEELQELLSGNNDICRQFRADIRAYKCFEADFTRRRHQWAPDETSRRCLHIHYSRRTATPYRHEFCTALWRKTTVRSVLRDGY
jgi:hypothetical protein